LANSRRGSSPARFPNANNRNNPYFTVGDGIAGWTARRRLLARAADSSGRVLKFPGESGREAGSAAALSEQKFAAFAVRRQVSPPRKLDGRRERAADNRRRVARDAR